jgi:hypothetical protein
MAGIEEHPVEQIQDFKVCWDFPLEEINPTGDMIANAVEYDQDITSGDGDHPVKQIQSFRVSREIPLEEMGPISNLNIAG